MTRWWTLLLAGGILAGAFGSHKPEGPHVLVLMGDTDGYLAPCGCTKPMTGGIKRRAFAVRTLTAGRPATILENGGLVAGTGRQDHLKAEALAESLRHMGVTAVALTDSEARLGRGLIESLTNLGGDLFIQSNLKESPSSSISRFRVSGPFLVGAVGSGHARLAATLGEASVANEQAARDLVDLAAESGKVPILLLADGRSEAERLARKVPGLGLIQFRSAARPDREPRSVGKTLLVSPGEKGKYMLRLILEDGHLKGYSAIELTPEFGDDGTVSRVYRRYLAQVEKENLLDKLPRSPGPKFAGNAKCGSCHAKAMKKWLSSEHSHALRTLISDGHGRDPDCVACHVVGLAKVAGFQSVGKTPQLANVGCESCHGSGGLHSIQPKVKMGKVGAKSCSPCHVPDHSPGFDFAAYWKRIAH